MAWPKTERNRVVAAHQRNEDTLFIGLPVFDDILAVSPHQLERSAERSVRAIDLGCLKLFRLTFQRLQLDRGVADSYARRGQVPDGMTVECSFRLNPQLDSELHPSWDIPVAEQVAEG